MNPLTRRGFVKTVGGPLAVGLAAPSLISFAQVKTYVIDPYKLPSLPYPADALEPYIDAETMTIHHDRHHAAYVANLNKAIEPYPDLGLGVSFSSLHGKDTVNPEFQFQGLVNRFHQLSRLPEAVQMAFINHGGGHVNHSLLWLTLAKASGSAPKGELLKAIENRFKNLNNFTTEMTTAAMGVFGSGWAWLSLDEKMELKIEATPNQNSPFMVRDRWPLFCIDVWEHAYYLKYQNKRADYIAAFFKVLNWDFVSDRYAKLLKA